MHAIQPGYHSQRIRKQPSSSLNECTPHCVHRVPAREVHEYQDEQGTVPNGTKLSPFRAKSAACECFGSFIPTQELGNESQGDFSRRRIFSKENTFWGFFTQVLNADNGCQEVVRKVQAFAASRSMTMPSASTSAYCQARSKLNEGGLKRILKHTSEQLQQRGRHGRWKDRRVVVVDGTGVSMPDTPDNQEEWPQTTQTGGLWTGAW